VTETKTKRVRRDWSAVVAADRIAKVLQEASARIVLARQKAEAEENAAIQKEIDRIVARVPGAERGRLDAVIVALGQDLQGFAITSIIDAEFEEASDPHDELPPEPVTSPASEPEVPAIPAKFLEEPPPLRPGERLVIDRSGK
jgi:hypothetical protein